MSDKQVQIPKAWTPALLDAFSGDVAEVHQAGDVIAPEFERETGVRYHATNQPGWSGNLYRYAFSIHEMERTRREQA